MEKENNFFSLVEEFYLQKKKWWQVFFLLGGLFVIFGFFSFFFSSSADTRVYFLSVGQGDSELIRVSGKNILIDGGPPNGRVEQELEKILPFWDRKIDFIFLTHPEADHFGGLVSLIKKFHIGGIGTNGQAAASLDFVSFQKEVEKKQIPLYTLFASDTLSFASSSFSVLSPSPSLSCEKINECGLVILFSSENKSVLFSADISTTLEKKLLPSLSHVDMVKIAHHGSRFSTSEAFLLQTSPQAVFIEVGKNSFGHPAPEIITRLKKFSIPFFRTDENGTLEVRWHNSELSIFSLE